jgi:hypothetical protein
LLGCVNKAVFSVLGRRQSSTAQWVAIMALTKQNGK